MGKALILSIAILAGCTTVQSPVDNPRQVWCDTSSPRRDATPETPRIVIDEINAHNAKGVMWCGWSA